MNATASLARPLVGIGAMGTLGLFFLLQVLPIFAIAPSGRNSDRYGFAMVEDDPDLVETRQDLFEAIINLTAVHYWNCEQLLADLGSGRRFMIIVMDNDLGDGLTGVACTAKVRAIDPRVLIIGNSADQNVGSDFLKSGADQFYWKAKGSSELAEIIYRLLK